MITLGIDPALGISGWAVLENGTLVHSGVMRQKSTVSWRDRAVALVELVLSKSPAPVCLVAVERPFIRNKSDSCQAYMMFYGVVVHELMRAHRVVEIDPTELKRFITGSTRAEKEAMGAYVKQVFPHHTPKTHDEADAICVALWGERLQKERPQ